MQRVIHEYLNKSRIFTLLEGLYSYISDSDYMFDDVLWLDECFKPLCNILEQNLYVFKTPEYKNFALPVIETKRREKEITVCFSGGKDSAATAKYYLDKGYTVHLYHATGVNKAYGDEVNAAKKIADYLGCDLFIDRISIRGKHEFIEHPLKNYLIANGAIHYCLANNYSPVIAFGTFRNSLVECNVFEVCGGDCVEMWDAYVNIIKKVIPDFELHLPLATNADTFKLLRQDWELFYHCISCMSPFRFREHWKHRTEQRYNVRLPENRCGCCWKCCMESIWLMDINKMPQDKEYYLHCFDILERTIYKENGQIADTVQEVWDNFMFYPMEESIYFTEIMQKPRKKRPV